MLEELHRTYVTLQENVGRLYLSPRSDVEQAVVNSVKTALDAATSSLEDALGITAAKSAGLTRKTREVNRDKLLRPSKV